MSSDPSPLNPGPPVAPPPPPASVPKTSAVGTRAGDSIIVYRHSNLFYWWPVWAIGFLFAIITYFHDQHLAVVPAGTVAAHHRDVDVDGNGTMEKRDVLIVDAKKHLWTKTADSEAGEREQPTIYVTHWRVLGSIYAFVLLMIIILTNVSVRGLWSIFFFMVVVMAGIILGVGGWWRPIFDRLHQLSIYINLGGYILISSVLFVMWALNFWVFDRQTYMVFTPGQVRIRLEIGGEETVYDTTGMVVQRERNDLFRHWVLGFGSGDLVIKPVGLNNPLMFPNVLGVERVVARVERMTKEKVIVTMPPQGA